ncbi:MAG TPA: VOC family protein [Thermomicrobiaceae bacterium]|nr:VOC family protein [Thermomicrobiaceae bacterium]
MSRPPIRSLGEIALQVHDMNRMVDFYANVVGLELLRRFPGNGPAFFRVAEGVEGHTQVLALFDRGGRAESVARSPSLDHLAFSLSLADLQSERDRVQALGVLVREETHGWVQWRSFYIDDPEGNVVEWVAFDPSIPGA